MFGFSLRVNVAYREGTVGVVSVLDGLAVMRAMDIRMVMKCCCMWVATSEVVVDEWKWVYGRWEIN